MNVTEYTYLLNHPNAINEKQAKSLETVLDNFPYFQSARALHLKGLYNQDSYKYNFVLKTTAAHTTDRSVLFDFITSDEFTIIEKDVYQQKLALLLNIDVNESEYLTPETLIVEKIKLTKIDDFKETQKVVEENEPIALPYFETSKETIEFIPVIEQIAENTNDETIAMDTVVAAEPVFEASELITVIETEPSTSILVEKNLEIGKPIAFVQSEKHSFQEWLQLTSFKPIDREIVLENLNSESKISEKQPLTEEKSDIKTKKTELIDKFIENNPKITPARELVDTPIKLVEIPDTTHLMTETLARVYLEQKKYGKAIQAYEILILKYPEKSIFFADRIQNIKILQQNNQ